MFTALEGRSGYSKFIGRVCGLGMPGLCEHGHLFLEEVRMKHWIGKIFKFIRKLSQTCDVAGSEAGLSASFDDFCLCLTKWQQMTNMPY